MTKLKQGTFGKDKVKAYYRPGTSDENALIEVINKKAYRRASIGFDVMPGERWLCMGSNIGAFALYAKSKGAKSVTCYEPMTDCFEILKKNVPEFELHNSAVSNLRDKKITFFTPRREKDKYRSTMVPRKGKYPAVTVRNTYAGTLQRRKGKGFDGIKCDIEGAEHALLLEWLFPKAEKLVLEFHLSRNNSLPNLVKCWRMLKRHYKHVHTCPELMRLIKKGKGTGRTYFDRNIWAWGLK